METSPRRISGRQSRLVCRPLCGIQPDAYALFRAAKELLTGEPMVGLAELAERDIIRPWVLNFIFQAILLSRGEMKATME